MGTYEGCSRCDQGFGHFYVSVCVDTFSQLVCEEFWKGVAAIEEYPLEDVGNEVIPIDKVSFCGFVL